MPILGGNRSRENKLKHADKKYLSDSDIALQFKKEPPVTDESDQIDQTMKTQDVSFMAKFKHFFSQW